MGRIDGGLTWKVESVQMNSCQLLPLFRPLRRPANFRDSLRLWPGAAWTTGSDPRISLNGGAGEACSDSSRRIALSASDQGSGSGYSSGNRIRQERRSGACLARSGGGFRDYFRGKKEGRRFPSCLACMKVVPRLGLEPRTKRLRVFCSTN